MIIRCHEGELNTALARVLSDTGKPEDGLVFVAAQRFDGWQAVEDELAEVFELTQAAVGAGAPVVYIVGAHQLLGRAAPLDSAVAAALLAGSRAVAFERNKYGDYATVVARAADSSEDEIAVAVDLLLRTRGSNGHSFVLGAEHLGAALP